MIQAVAASPEPQPHQGPLAELPWVESPGPRFQLRGTLAVEFGPPQVLPGRDRAPAPCVLRDCILPAQGHLSKEHAEEAGEEKWEKEKEEKREGTSILCF